MAFQVWWVAKTGHDTNNDGKSEAAPFLTIDKAVNNTGLTSGDVVCVKASATPYAENTISEGALKPRQTKNISVFGYTTTPPTFSGNSTPVTNGDGGKFILAGAGNNWCLRFESADCTFSVTNAKFQPVATFANARPIVGIDNNRDVNLTLTNVDFDPSLISEAAYKASCYAVSFGTTSSGTPARTLTLKTCTFSESTFTGSMIQAAKVNTITIDGCTFAGRGYGYGTANTGCTILAPTVGLGYIEIKNSIFTGLHGIVTPTPGAGTTALTGIGFRCVDSTFYAGGSAINLRSCFVNPVIERCTIRGNWHVDSTSADYLVAIGYQPYSVAPASGTDYTSYSPWCPNPIIRNCDIRFVSANIASGAEHVLYVSPGSDYGLFENLVLIHPGGGGYGFVQKGDGATIRNVVAVAKVAFYFVGGRNNNVSQCTFVTNRTAADTQSAALQIGKSQWYSPVDSPTSNTVTGCILDGSGGGKYAVNDVTGDTDFALMMDRNVLVSGSVHVINYQSQTADTLAAIKAMWAAITNVHYKYNDAHSAVAASVQYRDAAAGDYRIGIGATTLFDSAGTYFGQTIGAYARPHIPDSVRVRMGL